GGRTAPPPRAPASTRTRRAVPAPVRTRARCARGAARRSPAAWRWPSAMPKGRRACRGTSTPRAPGRTRPAPRLPRAPGCGTRRCESGRRSSALTRAGTGSRPVPLHLHHGPDLDEAVALEDRAALRDLRRLGDVLRLDDRVAADQVLCLRERAVGHGLLLAGNDLA